MGGCIELDKLTFRQSSAKIPKEPFWIPVSMVADELEEKIDLTIKAIVEREIITEDGKILYETVFNDEVDRIKGISLKKTYEKKYTNHKTKTFNLPKIDGTIADNRKTGTLRLTIFVEEKNKAGELILKGVEKAKDEKGDLMKKLEEYLEEKSK